MKIDKDIPIPKNSTKQSPWDKQVRTWLKNLKERNRPKTDAELKEVHRQEIEALTKKAAESRANSR